MSAPCSTLRGTRKSPLRQREFSRCQSPTLWPRGRFIKSLSFYDRPSHYGHRHPLDYIKAVGWLDFSWFTGTCPVPLIRLLEGGMSSDLNEWKELKELQLESHNIMTYDANSPTKLSVVPYPWDDYRGRPVHPRSIWAHIRDYDVPKLLCFHGEEATTFTPKSGKQKGKAFAKCKRTMESCSYFVSFTQIHKNLRKRWANIATQAYPRKQPQADPSASQASVNSEVSSSAPLAPLSSPIKRRFDEHEEVASDRGPKRMKIESPPPDKYAPSAPSPLGRLDENFPTNIEYTRVSLEAKRSQVNQEINDHAALPARNAVASASTCVVGKTESMAARARTLLEVMLNGGGLPAEEFNAVFSFKECPRCKTMYYGNRADACPCKGQG